MLPENVFYTTGYTALPSSGNPILYTLRNRLPFFSYVDPEGEVTLLCWGFSAEGVNFGADRIVGINSFAEAVESRWASWRRRRATARRSAWSPPRRATSASCSREAGSRRSSSIGSSRTCA